MPISIHDIPVPLRVDEGGVVRVGNTRVTLEVVVAKFNLGATAEQIAESFDTLRLEDVYDVVGYYLRHKDEVDAYLREVDEQAQQLREEIEADQGSQITRQRLLERLKQTDAGDVTSSRG